MAEVNKSNYNNEVIIRSETFIIEYFFMADVVSWIIDIINAVTWILKLMCAEIIIKRIKILNLAPNDKIINK